MKLKEVTPVVGQKDAMFRSREGEDFMIGKCIEGAETLW